MTIHAAYDYACLELGPGPAAAPGADPGGTIPAGTLALMVCLARRQAFSAEGSSQGLSELLSHWAAGWGLGSDDSKGAGPATAEGTANLEHAAADTV